MPGDVVIPLAQFADQTVAGAAITDVREAARGRFARLLGHGNARRTQIAEQWLARTSPAGHRRGRLGARAGPGGSVAAVVGPVRGSAG